MASTPVVITFQRLASPMVGRVILSGFVALQSFFAFYTNMATNRDCMEAADWREQQNLTEEFDFIVVGGGSAGSVLANRLSLNNRVLLLELGGNPHPISYLAPSMAALILFPGTALLYKTLPQKHAAKGSINQQVPWPRGLGLGGSSNINGGMYQRGNPKDYDNWAKITGDSSWSFKNVLPYFKKLEDYHGDYPNSKLHSTGGPIRVEKDGARTLEKVWFRAAMEKGYRIKNSNLEQAGFGSTEYTMKNGLRCSTYMGYIKPILRRKNLKIYRYSRVIKVHMDKRKHAYGVTYIRHGQQRFVRAKKEIILSAGAIDTPKILMLSGIGPKHHLNATGIKTRANLPVGQNLQDHVLTLIGPFFLTGASTLSVSRLARTETVTDFLKYPREGIIASGGQSVTGFLSTNARNESAWPDIQVMPLAAGVLPGFPAVAKLAVNIKPNIMEGYLQDYGLQEHDGTFSFVGLQRPKSTGTVQLASRHPFVHPLIQPNYYSHPDDIKAMGEGIERVVSLVENTTAFARYNAHLIPHWLPGCHNFKAKSTKYFECYARHITSTTYHPVGTASMGKNLKDPRAVVDSKLRLLKTSGLRVIDASVMPVIVNANPNIPVIMIAEVGSDFIREYWQQQYAVCPYREYTFLYLDESRFCFYTRFT